jgi:hypothetical protein
MDHPGVEARSDLAGITQLAAVSDAEVQRTEAGTLIALLPADDDEFLPLRAFDLEPVSAALAAIWGIGLLRDDPLAAFLADRFEQLAFPTTIAVEIGGWQS